MAKTDAAQCKGGNVQRTVHTRDGRALAVEDYGDPASRPVLVHMGTPKSRHLYGRVVRDAAERGLRLIGYDRPGYGKSSPQPGRSVADCADDVRTICAELGIDRLATWGISGGGPHAAAGCGHIPERNHYSVTIVQTSAQDSVTLPDGYGPITTLAGDPNGSGVWFWADTKTTLSIFHVDGQGKLTSWPVLTGADNVYQAESGLAVTSAGMVWLGINATLTRLDPSTGAVQTWRIPAPGDNPAAESFRPSDVQRLYLVQAIAANPDGSQIAIAMDLSSSIELFDPAAGTFTQIAMPATSDTPTALAYTPDGTLGVGLANYQTHLWDTALVVRPGTTGAPKAIPVPDSRSITTYGTSGFIVGAADPSLLTTTGTVTPIAVPAAAVGAYTPDSGPAIIALPNGQLGAITKGGVFEYSGNAASVASATAGSNTLRLPGEQCPEPISTNGSPPPTPAGPCYLVPNAMAVDGAGGIWVVPSTTNENVEQIVS